MGLNTYTFEIVIANTMSSIVQFSVVNLALS